MTPRPGDQQVVLRDTPFVPSAVRLPRAAAQGVDATGPAVRADPTALLQAAAQAEGLRQGREEGLRSGREQGLREGHEEGLRRGLAAGEAQARSAIEAAVLAARGPLDDRARQVDAVLSAIGEIAKEAWMGVEDDVLALCYETLCRVLGDAVAAPEALRPQVARLLAASDFQGALTLHLHPSDAQLLDESRAAGQLPLASDLPVRWRADPRVVLGGCILAAAGGGIDARLETILEQCKAGLLQGRADRAAARAGKEGAP